MGRHHHEHTHAQGSVKNLRIAFFLNLGFTILEFAGGLMVNSVSIMSDALHDLGDSISIGISLILHKRSQKSGDGKYSFGYTRFSLFGALLNSLILVAGSVYVIYEAVGRIMHPQSPDAAGMVILAVIGVAVNGYAALRLKKGSSMNEQVVSLHLLEDVLGWVAVLIVAIVLLFADIPVLDPILSLCITFYILYNVVRRLGKTLRIFLQGIPEGMSLEEIKNKLMAVPHVSQLHHTHLWSLDGEKHVFTTHVKLRDIREFSQIIETKNKLKEILQAYPFSHYTIETELDKENCELAGDV